MVNFWGDGIAQSLFSKFTAYQSLESTFIGLTGRKLYCFSDMPIQLAATNRLHHRPPCSLNNEYWLCIYEITTKNIYCRRKCQNMRKNMRYAHFAKICEKCGKVPNMWQSHIRVFLTCLAEMPTQCCTRWGCVIFGDKLDEKCVCSHASYNAKKVETFGYIFVKL